MTYTSGGLFPPEVYALSSFLWSYITPVSSNPSSDNGYQRYRPKRHP